MSGVVYYMHSRDNSNVIAEMFQIRYTWLNQILCLSNKNNKQQCYCKTVSRHRLTLRGRRR